MNDELTLEDLVNMSGLPLRTVRFYMQEGLLPGPDTRGKNARYTEEHLERLEWIQRLKEHYWPLREIRILLNNMSPVEIKALLEGQDKMQEYLSNIKGEGKDVSSKSTDAHSALDYIRGIEGKGPRTQEVVDPKRYLKGDLLIPVLPSVGKQREQVTPSSAHVSESWQRIILKDGIEINLRMPIRSEDEANIKKLIALTRQLFENNQNGE